MWMIKLQADTPDLDPLTIYSDDVDLTSMPLVYIRKIQPRHRSTTIVLSEGDDMKEIYGSKLMIVPYHQVIRMIELKEQVKVSKLKGVVDDRISNRDSK